MPKTAIYCPLLTSWLTEQQGLHCSRQPILIEEAHAAITGEQPIILYQELIMPSDKQQCWRLKMKRSKDKAGSSLQAAWRWREMQVWWGSEEGKNRVEEKLSHSCSLKGKWGSLTNAQLLWFSFLQGHHSAGHKGIHIMKSMLTLLSLSSLHLNFCFVSFLYLFFGHKVAIKVSVLLCKGRERESPVYFLCLLMLNQLKLTFRRGRNVLIGHRQWR